MKYVEEFMVFYSMGQCKKDVTPLLTHWSYVFLALTHRFDSGCIISSSEFIRNIIHTWGKYKCPSVSEVTLVDMGKINEKLNTLKHKLYT